MADEKVGRIEFGPGIGSGSGVVTSIDHFQRRGRERDIIDEALAAYDQWYRDDDYDAKGALDSIMKRMRERREGYSERGSE